MRWWGLWLVLLGGGGCEGEVPVDETDPQDTGDTADTGDTGPNVAPTVTVDTPSGVRYGLISVTYTLADPNGDRVSVAVDVSTDGSFWAPATAFGGGEGSSDLEADPAGTAHTFLWDSLADLPVNADTVLVRFTPDDGALTGSPAQTGLFTVRNAGFGGSGLRISEVDLGAADYIELTNTGTAAVQLQDMVVEWSDDSNGIGRAALPALLLDPGAAVVVHEGAGTDDSDHVYPGLVIGWQQSGRGSATLVDADGNGLDFVRWGDTIAYAPAWTEWIETTPLEAPIAYAVLGRFGDVDTHSADDFCAMPPSPAAVNEPCLASGVGAGILLSELNLADPGDAVELVNTGSAAIDTTNWTIVWTSETAGTDVVWLPPATLPVGERLVLGEDAAGLPSSALVLGNVFPWGLGTGGSVALVDPFGDAVDFVRWGGATDAAPAGTAWSETAVVPSPRINAASLSRDASDTDTDTEADWCLQHLDLGQPGGACLPVSGPRSGVVISEINGGTTDYIELFNEGAVAVDLTMWSVVWTDEAQTPGAADLPAIVLDPGARLLLNENAGTSAPGVVYLGVNLPWNGGVSFGSATLYDPYGNGTDFVRWGGDPETAGLGDAWIETVPLPTPPDGQVLARDPAILDADDAGEWCLQAPSAGAVNGTCR